MHHTDTANQTHADPPQDMGDVLAFGPNTFVDCETLERGASAGGRGAFTSLSFERMRESCDILEAAHARGDEIYGLTTGFGPHVVSGADGDACVQGAGLIDHLGAGCGEYASSLVARGAVVARCQALAQGRSGVSLDAACAMLELLNRGITPAIPEVGSVGASGDLIPLAHVARVLTGEGDAVDAGGNTIAAREALRNAGLEPMPLTARDALAIVNGTSFMTAYAALALAKADRLVAHAERLTGWLMRGLGSRKQSLDPRLHEARGHVGQQRSAAAILGFAGTYHEDTTRPLQEVYSVRCAPQIIGACRDQIDHARTLIEREINGVNDNPVISGTVDDPAVLHGGNFQGQQLGFAADTLNSAITQVALLIERQLDVVCNPELNGGAPLLLAHTPGPTSGLAGAQITATAVAAELRRNADPSAIATIPTNGRNQDIVSMGTLAARRAYEQVDRVATVLAIQVIALTQLDHLRAEGRAPGARVEPQDGLPAGVGFTADRPLHADIARIAPELLIPGT